ncbi:MAG: helix-turn-helix transcriptional regulator [Bacteroidota bacterium]
MTRPLDTKRSTIPIYHEINDLHELTGSALRTTNPMFHCFEMAKANDLEVNAMAPHRVSFYTLALNFGTRDLHYRLNEQQFDRPQNFILCVAPGQVASWEKRDDWLGYCTFFKGEFLDFNEQVNFLHQYPFFNIQETNLIPIDNEDFEEIKTLFRLILEEQSREQPFAVELIKLHFQAILWKVRRRYEMIADHTTSERAGMVIASQFQYLVNQHFLKKANIDDYAELLNITPNHLSQTISKVTGQTAKSIINARRFKEARYLLSYTHLTISEIAFQLNFSEPTHFSKFFKKMSGTTPANFRTSSGQ